MSLAVRAIIFDVFETLVHNESHLWMPTFQDICRSQRLQVDPLRLWERWHSSEVTFRQARVVLDDLEHTPPFRTYWQAWRDCFQLTFAELGLVGDPVAASDAMIQALRIRPPYEDALPVLEHLRQGPWTLAVLSNADDAFLHPILERTGFPTFHTVLSSQALRAYKPHPITYQRTLEALRCAPEDAVYIGDRPLEDVHGPKQQGMHAVLLSRNGTQWDDLLTPPDYEISSLLELLDILAYPEGER